MPAVDIRDAKVLVVDDDELILDLLQHTLCDNNYTVFLAGDGETALGLLTRLEPDIILLDIYMPDMNGIELCREIKKLKKFEQTPILFMTSTEDEIRSAYEAGGVDYVVKPLKINALLARINTQVKMSRLMTSLEQANHALESLNESLEDAVKERTRELTEANESLLREMGERKHLQERLQYLQRYDFVTRMLNRSAMEEQLALKLQAHFEEDQNIPWHLLFINLDRFELVTNDCGNDAGDDFLHLISNDIKTVLHVTDVAARMGGSEFAVLYQEHRQGSEFRANEIKAAIENCAFNWEGNVFKVGASMGLVELDASISGVAQLVSAASHSCNESKSRGGSQITSYQSTKAHIDGMAEQTKWISTLQSAIEKEDIELFVQQICYSVSTKAEKYEVLIRLRDDHGRLVQPSQFIPIAERYHLISAIDRYVIEKVIAACANISPTYQFSVNISGETIAKPDTLKFIDDLFDTHGIHGEQICFEITETSAISNLTSTREFIAHLRGRGCQFSLDDFGTGTSSYGYLKQLPVDYLKIDGMFVRDIERERISRLMVESMVSIAFEMNIKIIAECVESREALEALRILHVPFVQGYFLHKPEPFAALFSENSVSQK